LIFDDEGDLFNMAAHFMATNPMIKIMEPVLAIGFIVHIVWSLIITLQNMKARPVRYEKTSQGINSTWASRNMLILGGLIFVFLGIHIYNFWYHMKIVKDLAETTVVQAGVHVEMENAYLLVSELFKNSVGYCLFYIAGAILLGLHITHGFWSAFQTIGLNNQIWRKRLYLVAQVIGYVFMVGFSAIPLYFMIKF
jgi:succinate dehydrogenase / fumarate reductase, cytochrome b subunit